MPEILAPTTRRTRREEIVHHATLLFFKNGYPNTTMRALAQHVGIEAASLYNHVSGKEDILQAICFEIADQFRAHMDEVLASPHSPLDKIKSIISRHIALCVQYPEAIMVMDNEWQHMSADDKAAFKKLRSKHENHIVQFLREGMDRGQIALAPPRVLMYTILSSLQWIPRWYKPEREMSVEDLQKSIRDLIIMGISL